MVTSTNLDGAGTPPPEGVSISSPAEFAALWNGLDEEARAGMVLLIQRNSEASLNCFVRNHAGLEATIVSLRQQLADANVSRETLPGAVDASLLQMGQHVEIWTLPLDAGTGPDAYGNFVYREVADDGAIYAHFDHIGDALTFDVAAHVFVPTRST